MGLKSENAALREKESFLDGLLGSLQKHVDDLSSDLEKTRRERDALRKRVKELGKEPRPSGTSVPSRPDPYSELFHRFFNWLEDDPDYQKVYSKIEQQPVSGNCLYCKKPVQGDGLLLQSPRNLHRACYDELYNLHCAVTSEEEARALFRDFPNKISLFRWTLTHWPTYPPDWEVRRERILNRDHFTCQNCGRTEGPLHVHHIEPIQDGGLHTPENLTTLCVPCHEEVHGYTIPDTTTPGKPKPGPFAEKIAILRKAMTTKRRVAFHYRDQEGQETNRTFTPQGWTRRHNVLCISGYCHLRHEKRTFIIKHMSQLILVE